MYGKAEFSRTMRPTRPASIRFLLALAAGVLFAVPALATGSVTHPAQNSAVAASEASAAIATARKRVASGDLAGALAQLSAFVGTHPQALEAARYLGDLYYREHDLASAEGVYLGILKAAPDDRLTHDRLGGVYSAQDRIPEALAEFAKSLPSGEAYGHIVELHRRLGDLDALLVTYREAAGAAPQDPVAQYAVGTILRADRKPKEAASFLERGLALAPLSCPILTELGSAYLDLNRNADAVDMLERCLAHSPDDYPALVNLGDALILQQKFERAQVVLERALEQRPDGAEAMVNLGYLEDVSQRWQSAVAYYLKAIALDPLSRDAYVDLGYDYTEHQLFPLAEAAFLKGLTVSPGDGRLHYLLGVTYADQGKRDLALAEYRRATSSDEPEVARAASKVLTSLQ